MSLTKWSSKISSVAGAVKTTNLALWYENSVTGRPSKDHKPYKMKPQNFVRGRPYRDHKPGNLGFENGVTGRPSKDHEPYKDGSVAGRAKTIRLVI